MFKKNHYSFRHLTRAYAGAVQTSLYNHNVVVSVENLVTQQYNKDDQYIRAFMSEIMSVFKDIAQLNLMEQLKGIEEVLGLESDGIDKLIEKFKEHAAALKIPEAICNVFDEEIAKLARLKSTASDA